MLNKPDQLLKKEIESLLTSKHYKENTFTDMVKGIIKKEKWSIKERKALELHLMIFWDNKLKG